MAGSLEAAIIALLKGRLDAGYTVGIPELHDGALFIPIAEKNADLEAVLVKFDYIIRDAVKEAPTINLTVAHNRTSVILSPSIRGKGHVLEDTENFLMAYKMLLEGASMDSIKSSILDALESRRQPQDMIIGMLKVLRGHESGISLSHIGDEAGLNRLQVLHFSDYLSKRGLIDIVQKTKRIKSITITEQGREAKLVPENFMDYMREGGKRTKIQIYRDIADVIYEHGGRAFGTSIMNAANLAYHQLTYLKGMVEEGYVRKEVWKGKKRGREVYVLTSSGASKLLGVDNFGENASLDSIVEGKRDSSGIIISILSALRKAEGSLPKNKAIHLSNMIMPQFERYLDYLLSHGLVEPLEDKKPLTLTENGWNTPLKPEQFMDYGNKSGKRTKIQIYRDIADVIYEHDGRALITHIVYGANLVHPAVVRYLDDMIKERYISKVPVDEKQRDAYELTDDGKSIFPDPGVRVEVNKKRDVGEVLAKILELAQHGANKTKLMYAISVTHAKLNEYVGFLLEHNLISQSGDVFKSVEVYNPIDKESLPYALDTIMREDKSDLVLNSKRTAQSIQLDTLQETSEPHSLGYLINILGGERPAYKNHIVQLQQKGYLEPVPHGKYTLYQRTPAGTDFLNRINATADMLKVVAQKAA